MMKERRKKEKKKRMRRVQSTKRHTNRRLGYPRLPMRFFIFKNSDVPAERPEPPVLTGCRDGSCCLCAR